MCSASSATGSYVVIDVMDSNERMGEDARSCTCYLTPITTKVDAYLYVLHQNAIQPGYNGCGSRVDIAVGSNTGSGVLRNTCYLGGSILLKNNTLSNITYVKEFPPYEDRYCVGLQSGIFSYMYMYDIRYSR